MIERKALSSVGVIFMIVVGIILGRMFESLTSVEAQSPAMVSAPVRTIPYDFDWETYIQNYEDLRRAGITTEAKARQHWMEYGKAEGRTYCAIKSLPSEADEKAEDRTNEAPLATFSSVSGVLLDPPLKIDRLRVRERYDKLQQRVGVKTKEEAMDLSLDFWEKRRKAYSL